MPWSAWLLFLLGSILLKVGVLSCRGTQGAALRRETAVPGLVKVTAEPQRCPLEAAPALSSLRLKWRRGQKQCGANDQ